VGEADHGQFDDAAKADLKRIVETSRGYWHPFHQGLLDYSPAYLQAYLDFHEPAFLSGNLDVKTCEYIYIAVDSAVSHLFVPGTEMHIKVALEKGGTPAEIMEVIQLAMLAAHSSHTVGIPILIDELARAGVWQDEASRPLTAAEEASKASYIAATGHWPEGADALFRFAPDFVKGFLSYGEIPYREGPLPKKIKEFICIAVYASPVAPQPAPLRQHIRRALEVGATPHEIADVLQLSSAIAIHTCVAAIPPLVVAAQGD
jgi:alkylhydroperoxidase/carboxymuconolactone decarboxylase family protein YurZ